MPVLTRSALEASPLADLHALATELGVDGFRRLRRDDLVGALLRAGGEDDATADGDRDRDADADGGSAEAEGGGRRRTRRRGGRGGGETDRADAVRGDGDRDGAASDDDGRGRGRGRAGGRARDDDEDGHGEGGGRRRSRRRGGREGDDADEPRADERASDDTPDHIEGDVHLAGSGSGFVRVSPDGPSDGDVYVSGAQIKRCGLVEGDRVGGPVRPARRGERHPSLARVETINGRPADEAAGDPTPVQRQAAVWPHERLALGGEDATVKAIEWLTPLGRGSRATICGPARAGKSEALRRVATALAGVDDVELIVALAGIRPEEVGDWAELGAAEAALDLGAPEEKRTAAIEEAVERGRRLAARGEHAVVVVDTLDDVDETAARRLLASARRLEGGGSLTVIATSTEPVGGESTVVALDVALTSTGRLPALDLGQSGTLRPELLVGAAGASAIAAARAEALGEPQA